jgi:DNA-binding NarL/FixJ family response regulator
MGEQNYSATHDGAGVKLLIVEDHGALRFALRRRILAEFPKLDLIEADSGEHAVDMALAEHPQLILMDIGLPHMDGIESARRIHSHYPDIHIAAVSVRDDPHSRARAHEAGITRFIAKREMGRDLLNFLQSEIPRFSGTAGSSGAHGS